MFLSSHLRRSQKPVLTVASLFAFMACSLAEAPKLPVSDEQILSALKQHSISPDSTLLASIGAEFRQTHDEWCRNQSTGNSKVSFSAVQIAHTLGLNPKVDGTALSRVRSAVTSIRCTDPGVSPPYRCGTGELRYQRNCIPDAVPTPSLAWNEYFQKTLSLNSNGEFLKLLQGKSFFPVKISWEDIGRYEGSVWGDRISDVGIWVRKTESDPQSAELALSVRRDSNFRDKVLVVPAQKIKVHIASGGSTREVTLADRLKELNLSSASHDNNVIVSNQFAIVPVPAVASARDGSSTPPRSAFNFSIYPYGSTNYVITDVIEGSSDAIVGAGSHQLLYSNVSGKKAPFTASRAAERKDLLELESKLKAQGMDVDVQRYYLIQVPLKRDASGVQLSNMGTPPFRQAFQYFGSAGGGADLGKGMPASAEGAPSTMARRVEKSGLEKVAIGHGEVEGDYFAGGGFSGQRAEEPIRVTVVYFVTPVGEVSSADMDTFTKAFESWDGQAIWGGSFVVKE